MELSEDIALIKDELEKDEVSEAISSLSADMYYRRGEVSVYLPDFARDVVLNGKVDPVGLLERYNIDANDFAAIVKMPIFKSAAQATKSIMADGDHAIVQLRAMGLIDKAMGELEKRILDGQLDNKELLAALKLLTDVSGAKKPVAKQVGDIIGPVNTGTVLNLSFADLSGIPMPRGDEPVNETYKRIKAPMVIEDVEVEDE